MPEKVRNTEHDATRPEVRLDVSAWVGTLTLDRPEKRNALTADGWRLLRQGIEAARHDPDVRVVVITGAGGSFCTGTDLVQGVDQRHPIDRMRDYADLSSALYEMPKPVIAKVDGPAVGAGCNLALGADFVLASEQARFSEIFVHRGMSLDMGGAWALTRLVGLRRAKQIAMLGDFIDAHAAETLGLITAVHPRDELDAATARLVDRLLGLPAVALALTKSLLHEAHTQTLRESLESEGRAQCINLATDAPAARRAFFRRTTPEFTGRWQVSQDFAATEGAAERQER